MQVLLFDVDGTLLLSGGAGKRGMDRAFEKLFGVKQALNGVPLAGFTDRHIFRNVCSQHGLPCTEETHDAFKQYYIEYLQEEIRAENPEKYLLPGVENLLNLLSRQEDVKLGLLTGNYAETAKIKLGHFSIDHFFAFGAYGDDAEEREKLLPFAMQRFKELTGTDVPQKHVWVIGDTPRDVSCAKPHRVRTIAVMTGFFSKESLAKENPDYILRDFQDPEKVLQIIQNQH